MQQQHLLQGRVSNSTGWENSCDGTGWVMSRDGTGWVYEREPHRPRVKCWRHMLGSKREQHRLRDNGNRA